MSAGVTGDLPARYGRWAFVAGASAGLGAAFAESAARRGFDLVLLARRRDALEATATRVAEKHGVETRCIVADLARPDIGDVVGEITDQLDIGVFVYNAAAEPAGRFLDLPLDEHLVNIAVNCTTPTVLAHRLGRAMAARRRGAIALVSSMAALQGIKMFASYGAAKAYELILAEGVWDELRDHGVDAVGYVVGATASSNYQGAAADAYEDTPGGSTLAQRILTPATPESVAERLFERLDGGPRQYSHDQDEAAAEAMASKSRAEAVQAMGEVTTRLARFQPGG